MYPVFGLQLSYWFVNCLSAAARCLAAASSSWSGPSPHAFPLPAFATALFSLIFLSLRTTKPGLDGMVQPQILHMKHIEIAEIVKADIKTCLWQT